MTTGLLAAIAAIVGLATGVLTTVLANRRPSELATLIATMSLEIGRLQARVEHLEAERNELRDQLDHVPKRATDTTAQEAVRHA